MDSDYVNHLCQLYPLKKEDLLRLWEEFQEYYKETPEEYIRRRHIELQSKGYRNQDIFKKIQDQLKIQRFKSTPLSTRQIRRIIYG